MATITGPLSGDAKNTVAEALQGALVDLIDLSLVAKQAHWNLIGTHFRSIHLQLDEVVALARTHMDTIAERAVALGVNPDGRAATIARTSDIQQPESGWIEDGKVLATITDVLDGISKRMYERIRATEEADPVSQDLLIAVAQEIDKQHWMFQAQR
ncbi:Non-specific DNA-binding protein Dps / Iron-binding ferritin-like antioxidant protein / Ferroxidase [[Actinomadura] parvosata subsp. kistnae]|uniref:DNA starvation/stationary phase protection protein n=2 Tax=Nonomuraea TaxID=83681 RepID=A0A1V0A3X1_9ACTN|nr:MULTISPECIES: DNA starvation/stationary phase protection protein [unclassified Nonomuraea]AQZ64903.1 DNA starvation/stationary phase protection protein [Nonomuraea sp. ATCC 55076]NJP90674.1 DNA starvation/stationary phase protection protein [Nonomuraea sp. FMUSA5-5]SPL96126.1 Non-specific DNA-binding protein Dps / Iron-binding ferritin-like antioxidant protein / Ferroxidase [Actinomadura parvosata subsp. kistnae]